ncbi:uncharacterized protein SOCE26_037350 [Sorangium cellulosum]|uniref:Alanine--tRNA ligase n=1 Tax=Sorangium cellulosum TaxID=56 RepID=A0A2L0ESP8_SORCE|nr:DHHA1 domain-containing protein [Sorangium cellulosum]AUX42305.1 uncharacterized protein SOCE26_037350 [Sorangium cellulosum]
MKLYDASSIEAAPWSDTAEGGKARSFLVPLFQQGTQAFFGDRSTLRLLSVDDLLIPLSINEAEYDNSYFFSMYARYIASQRAAIATLDWSPAMASGASSVLSGLGALLKATQIDRCIQVDNWPSLRNMAAPLSAGQIRRITDFLAARYPEHAILFPALSPATHAPLLNRLKEEGYAVAYMSYTRMLLPHGVELSRRVRENRRRDARLLEASGYEVVDGRDMPGCAPRLAELYQMLNREKYKTNPPISPAFFEACLRGEMVRFRLVVKDGRIDTFYGFMVKDDVLYSPAAGYELSIPQEVGLYRILNNLLMREALERGIAIETGGGADSFKVLRGDRPVPRYNAVYVRHLPVRRRLGWGLLQRLANDVLLKVTRAILQGIDEAVVGFDSIPETFTPPFMTPRESAERLRRDLDALEREVEAASALEGRTLADRLPALTKALEDWPFPPPRVVGLRQRLDGLARRQEEEKRSRRASLRAQRAVVARQLLEGASTLGDATVVVHHLGEIAPQQLRALAEQLCKAAAYTAVALTGMQGGTVMIVAATTPGLVQRGVEASQVLAQAAPAVEGKAEGGPEVAWAEGSRPEGAAAALEAARRYLEARLD